MENPLTSPQAPRIAVIGGGITGLAAAHRLRRLLPHADLRLYEASDRLGGPLHTIRTSDALLEQGADSFLMKTPWALDLCRELGLADQLVPTNEHHRRALVVRKGKLLPVPDGFVLMHPHNLRAMMRSPVLSRRGKLRLLAEPLIRPPAAAMNPDYDESVASFATRRLGRETFERLVQPLIAGIFVADAHRLSLAATFPEFLQAERDHGSLRRSLRSANRDRQAPVPRPQPPASAARYGQFVTLRRGMSSLIEALANSLPTVIQLRSPVRHIARDGTQRWSVKLSGHDLPESFDGVIIATPAPIAAVLVAQVDPTLDGQLSRIDYASSVVVTLVYPRDNIAHPLNGFGAVVPAVERRPIIAASFLTVKFPQSAPADRAVIRVFMGGMLHPEMIDRSDVELVAIAQRELQELLGARGALLETHVARWVESMPQYHVGHVQLVRDIESRVAAYRGLELAGSSYRGVGIPQCIHSGREAADRLAKQLTAANA